MTTTHSATIDRTRFARCPSCNVPADLRAVHGGVCAYCRFKVTTDGENGSLSPRIAAGVAVLICSLAVVLFSALPAHAAIPRGPATPAAVVAVAPTTVPVAPSPTTTVPASVAATQPVASPVSVAHHTIPLAGSVCSADGPLGSPSTAFRIVANGATMTTDIGTLEDAGFSSATCATSTAFGS